MTKRTEDKHSTSAIYSPNKLKEYHKLQEKIEDCKSKGGERWLKGSNLALVG